MNFRVIQFKQLYLPTIYAILYILGKQLRPFFFFFFLNRKGGNILLGISLTQYFNSERETVLLDANLSMEVLFILLI